MKHLKAAIFKLLQLKAINYFIYNKILEFHTHEISLRKKVANFIRTFIIAVCCLAEKCQFLMSFRCLRVINIFFHHKFQIIIVSMI